MTHEVTESRTQSAQRKAGGGGGVGRCPREVRQGQATRRLGNLRYMAAGVTGFGGSGARSFDGSGLQAR